MVNQVDGTFKTNAWITSMDALKRLLRNENRVNLVRVSVDEMKSYQYWDEVAYEVNFKNSPMAFTLPGIPLNPFLKMKGASISWLDNMIKTTPDRTSIWLPVTHGRFPCPVPCVGSDAFNHVTRTRYFNPRENQVIKTQPRVCRGHNNHGFGWLYSVQGITLFLYINDPNRIPGSDGVPGCPIGTTDGPWELDSLSLRPDVKYFILYPGTIIFIPPNTRHIVISLQESLSYGSFSSHIYGAVSDLANYLDLHRETNPDLPTIKDAIHGIGISDSSTLASQIIKILESEPNWNKEYLSNIVRAKRASFVSDDRSLLAKSKKIISLCK